MNVAERTDGRVIHSQVFVPAEWRCRFYELCQELE